MTREETEKQFALMILSAYKKRQSRQGIKNGIGIVFLVYLIIGFLPAVLLLHSKIMVIIFAFLLLITILGDLFFLMKTRSKKGCSGLYVLWDTLSLCVLITISCYEIMYDIYNANDRELHISLICLTVSIILSMAIELIVDIIYIKKGKLQTKLENIKGPGGAAIYAIVSILTSYTSQSFAQMIYFLGGVIAGTFVAAMVSKIFYRLHLIKKHNLWDYFGYFNKDTPYDNSEVGL